VDGAKIARRMGARANKAIVEMLESGQMWATRLDSH